MRSNGIYCFEHQGDLLGGLLNGGFTGERNFDMKYVFGGLRGYAEIS
jgi:hypothetical protein